MNKVLLGLLLGAILGAIDGMTAWFKHRKFKVSAIV